MKKSAFLGIVFSFIFLSSLKCQDRYIVDRQEVSDKYASEGQPEKEVPVSEWLTAERAVLLFWTTWCPYCRSEIKNLNSLCDELEAKGIKVYFINVQETPSKVRSFAQKMQIKCPIVLDTRGSIAYRYRIPGFPTYIFLENGVEIDRNSFISRKYVGRLYAL